MFNKIYKGFKTLLTDSQKSINKQLTLHDKVLLLLENLDSSDFKDFNNSKNSIITIRSIYNRLPLYNSKLKEVNYFLSNHKAIYIHWCTEQIQNIQINDFFLTEENYYIDEVSTVEEFKNNSIAYFNLYYEKNESVGIVEHNTRVLTSFTENLIMTIEDLILVSNQS